MLSQWGVDGSAKVIFLLLRFFFFWSGLSGLSYGYTDTSRILRMTSSGRSHFRVISLVSTVTAPHINTILRLLATWSGCNFLYPSLFLPFRLAFFLPFLLGSTAIVHRLMLKVFSNPTDWYIRFSVWNKKKNKLFCFMISVLFRRILLYNKGAKDH